MVDSIYHDIKITVQSLKSYFLRENVRGLPYIGGVVKSVIS